MEGIEGLSEALQALQVALDKVNELMPADRASEQQDNIDENTAATEQDESSENTVASSGAGTPPGDDVNKSSAVAAIQKLLG